jgi:hypothetical protein
MKFLLDQLYGGVYNSGLRVHTVELLPFLSIFGRIVQHTNNRMAGG